SHNWSQYRIEVLCFLVALEAQHVDALGFNLVAEGSSYAFTIGSLVVNDVNALDLQFVDSIVRTCRALRVVTPAHTIDRRVTAIGDGDVGVGRGNHHQPALVINFRGRQRNAGIEVADHAQNGR